MPSQLPNDSQHRFKLSKTASSSEKPLEADEERQPTKTDQSPAYFLTIFVLTLLPLLVYFLLLHRPIQLGHEKQEMNSRTASSLFSVVYVTVPSMEVGKRIAREVVGQRLAACVNIVPQLTSIYEWKGKLEEDAGESMLIIKTGTDRLEALKQAVLKAHPYDVPEFIALPIEHGSEPYLKWIREQTSASSTSGAVDATPIDPTTSSPMEPTKAAEDGRGKPS